MKNVFSQLLRQSGLYAVGNLLLKLSGLVLLPLYLNHLTETSYGHFALLDATARVAILVAGLGLSTGLLRFMTSSDYEAERGALPMTALATSAGAAAVLLGVVWAAAPQLASLLLAAPAQAPLVRLMAAYAALKIVEAIPIMLMRVKERVGLYVVATGAELVVLVGAVLVLLVRLDRGLGGVMEAYVLSAAVGTLVLVGGMVARVDWRFRGDLLAPLVRFGLPLVFAGLAALFMNLGDRYLLRALTDAAVVGIYDWAARLGSVVNMLFTQSFQLAFNVIGLKVLGEERGGPALYRRTFRHFVIWTGWFILGLALLAYDFTLLVADKDAYLAVEVLVLPVALGFLMHGVYHIMVNVLLVRGKTTALAGVVFGAAVANALLNVALIPFVGALGAALATLLAYGLLMVLAARVAERQIRIGYAWGRLGVVVALVTTLFLAGHATVDWATLPRLAARGALIAAYLPLLLVVRLYTPAEVRAGVRVARAAWRRYRGR